VTRRAEAADTLISTLTSLPATPVAPAAPASQPATFGILDLRGRTLSQDATFRISKAVVVEVDPDAGGDMTLAKHLRLVIPLDPTIEPLFASKTRHTISVTNPDSQKVVYRFDIA